MNSNNHFGPWISFFLVFQVQIQERMENFMYGYFDIPNQPPPIQVKHLRNDQIVATASQKLCLFKLFPIIFHDIINDIPSFIVYKHLREILDLVLSVPFRKQWLPVLRDYCLAFNQSMVAYFPSKMIPKVHFICEYEQIIHDFGPSTRYWCFRYESSHVYFKRVVNRSNNFKNIPKMLSTRYCLKQSFRLSQSQLLKTMHYSVGMKKLQYADFDARMKTVLRQHFGDIDIYKDLVQCTKLYHENIEYCRSGIYIIDLTNPDEQPIFAQVVFIIRMEEKWWLLVDILRTKSYDENLFSWEVQSMNHYSILDPGVMKYFYKGLSIYELKNSSFVSFTARLTFY